MTDAELEELQYESATERYRSRLARESRLEQQQAETDTLNFGEGAASPSVSQPPKTQTPAA